MVVLLALLAFRPSVISSFLPKIRGAPPPPARPLPKIRRCRQMTSTTGPTCSFESKNRCTVIEELASFLETVMFIIKFDTSRFGVKGPALRIELVSKHIISGFNPRGMLQ